MGHPGEQAPREERRPADGLREDRLRRDDAGPPARPAGRVVRAPPEGGRRRLHQDPALLHARSIRRTINDHKHAWVERIGDECRANDIPFFLEVIAYEEGAGREGRWSSRRRSRSWSTGNMREFTKDQYGVDVLKVEVPVNMKFVEGMKCFGGQQRLLEAGGDGRVPAARRTSRRRPFIYLSAGVSNAGVQRDAGAGGARPARGFRACCAAARRGRTASRSTAKQGADAFRKWLEDEGVKNIANVNARLKPAHPWFEFYGAKSADELACRAVRELRLSRSGLSTPLTGRGRCRRSRGPGSSPRRARPFRSA